MEKSNIKLSLSQIQKMKHAIGLDYTSPKNGVFKAYRNNYVDSQNDEWEELVGCNLAGKQKDPFCPGDFIYFVSKAGIEYLEELVGIKITLQ